MTATRSTGAARPARTCTAYLRTAHARTVRWFQAPRLVRTRRRRRAALAAAALTAGSATTQVIAPAIARLAVDAVGTAVVMHDVPANAPFALVLRTVIPTPVAGTRMVVHLTVVSAAGWRATLSVHLEPAMRSTLPAPGARASASQR
jgi:hypothetical protein